MVYLKTFACFFKSDHVYQAFPTRIVHLLYDCRDKLVGNPQYMTCIECIARAVVAWDHSLCLTAVGTFT